jgi:hypothetical protein
MIDPDNYFDVEREAILLALRDELDALIAAGDALYAKFAGLGRPIERRGIASGVGSLRYARRNLT